MTDKVLEQLMLLVPVIAGAVIALAGGWLKHWVERREQRKHRRREKLERILHLVYSLKPWTDSLDSHLAFGVSEEELASPIEEIEVIANLYFHDLQSEVNALIVAARRYKGAMLTLSAERLRSGQVPPSAEIKIRELFPPVSAAIGAFTDKARNIAKELS